MSEPAERSITVEEAWALVDPERWAEIHAIERAELRAHTVAERLRGFDQLLCSWPVPGEIPYAPPAAGTGVAEDWPRRTIIALAGVDAWLRACDLEAVFVGGVAVAIVARPRYTRDLDVMAIIPDERLEEVLVRLPEFGLALLDPAGAREQARRRGLLLLHHLPSQLNVDVLLAVTPFHAEAVRAARHEHVYGIDLRVPRAEDLIILKALASRGQDQIDISYILDLCEDLDLARVRRIVGEVAVATCMPELLENLERLIALAERQRRR
jgi:predicted nucleotidyltransferase